MSKVEKAKLVIELVKQLETLCEELSLDYGTCVRLINLRTDAQEIIDTSKIAEWDSRFPLQQGYKRKWYKCSSCGTLQCKDYIPYSLSNPVLTARCGHDWSDLKEL